mmetsp:Transcript_61019/g.137996  ORF Transcript_61019/g.137996 Transcript_61019/m.137996 type:complete len:254 (-) Transcript_61019:90-851(-)
MPQYVDQRTAPTPPLRIVRPHSAGNNFSPRRFSPSFPSPSQPRTMIRKTKSFSESYGSRRPSNPLSSNSTIVRTSCIHCGDVFFPVYSAGGPRHCGMDCRTMDMLRVQSVKATVDKLAPELVRGARAGTDRTAATDETSVKKCHSHPESTPPAAPKKNKMNQMSKDMVVDTHSVSSSEETKGDEATGRIQGAIGRVDRRPSGLSLLLSPATCPVRIEPDTGPLSPPVPLSNGNRYEGALPPLLVLDSPVEVVA